MIAPPSSRGSAQIQFLRILCLFGWALFPLFELPLSRGTGIPLGESFLATQRLFGKGDGNSVLVPVAGIPLDVNKLALKVRTCKKKVFILDYDGTLTAANGVKLGENFEKLLFEALEKLNEDESFFVAIVSGREARFLDMKFGKYNKFLLSGEVGAFIRDPMKIEGQSEWKSFIQIDDSTWKKEVLKVMDKALHEDIPELFTEEKEKCVGFHYRHIEEEEKLKKAKKVAQDLVTQLKGLKIDGVDLFVFQEDASIEVFPTKLSKGAVVEHVLELVPNPDIIVCAGDWKTDEHMFEKLHGLEKDMNKPPLVVTVHVENFTHKETNAKFRVADANHILKMIRLSKFLTGGPE